MGEDFSQLELDGSIISELRVVPSRKIVMTLLRGPKSKAERPIQTEHDLQFNGVEHFNIAVEAEPWLQVVSHSIFSESEYLKQYLGNFKQGSEDGKLFHFKFVCGRGTIDIVAKTVTFSLFNEIPYVS
jgi:hypothetical protein